MRPTRYIVEVRAVAETEGNTSYTFPYEGGSLIGRFQVTREFVDCVDERVLIDVLGHKVFDLVKL